MNSVTKTFRRVISFVLCAFMLLNMVVVGYAERTMGAKMYWTNDISAQDSWKDVENADSGTVFEVSGFESGSETVRYLKIENAGSLAFSYVLGFVSEETVDSLANVIDVYYKSEVTENTAVADMTCIGTLAEVINGNAVSTGKMLPADLVGDGFYSGNTTLALALKMQDNASKEYMNKSLTAFSLKLDVNECEFEYPEVDKFELVFENTDKYLYRVGNANAVKLGSLFKAIDGADIGNVNVTIEAIDTSANVSGTFSANTSDWKASTIQFTGTGSVKVTIDDDDYAKALSLNLEVVNATNATSATSATANNVVLLNDVSGTFTVNGGKTLYGNGFKVTLPTDHRRESGAGFSGYIHIDNGNLDNVQIIGPVYPEQYIYRDQALTGELSNTGQEYIDYFVNSVFIYGGNCTISNSYISGSRSAICVKNGNDIVIENTTVEGGAYANIEITSGIQVTLKDVTTIQTPTLDSYGKNKMMMGLGVVVSSSITDVYFEGELNQYNWVSQSEAGQYVPDTYSDTLNSFYTDSAYQRFWHYRPDDSSTKYINYSIIYSCDWDKAKTHDNHTNDSVYDNQDVAIPGEGFSTVNGGIRSNANNGVLTDELYIAPEYITGGFAPVAPVFSFDNSVNNEADDPEDQYDTYCEYTDGVLKIGLTQDSKEIDLSGATVLKNNKKVNHTAYLNGNQINGDKVTIYAKDGVSQTLKFSFTDNANGYDPDGNAIAGETLYSWTVPVQVATLAYPAPAWNMGEAYTFNAQTNCCYPYYATSQGYAEAVPIYEGIKVKYYNKSGELVEVDLSGTSTVPTPKTSTRAIGDEFTYTLSDGSTLTMKYISGWKSGVTAYQFTKYNNKLYIYPSVLDDNNWVRAKVTSQNFDLKIAYTFTDPNGQSVGATTMQWYNAAASNGNITKVQWKTFDSTNGKECLAEGTLITLADGSQKAIEDLTYSDELRVWDFFKGEYTTTVPSLLINDGEADYKVINLKFDDNTTLRVIYEHGLYDVEANNYVYINKDNVADFVGHKFIKNNGLENTTVELVDFEITEEHIGCYTLLTAQHNNCIAEGLLTVTPPPIDGWYDYFEIGEGMKYDEASMQQDIETYGLYTYDDFADYISYEEFVAFNGAYLKILVGKGYFTFEDILKQIEIFGVGVEESTISPLSDEEADITIIAPNNTVSTGVYGIEIASENATLTEDGAYICDAKNSAFTITATGSASTGYAIITVDGDTLYTGQIAQGESIAINVKNAVDKSVSFDYNWGSSVNYGVSQDNLYETGSTIDLGEVSIASVEKTDKGVLVKFSNTTKYDTTGDVYVAVYDTTSKSLVRAARVGGFSVLSGGCEHEEIIELPENCTLKAFLWSTSGMVPVTASLAN